MKKFAADKNRINWSHKIFPTDRNVKFMEMEYNVPLEDFELVLKDNRAVIKDSNYKLFSQ
jgi:hypothetical protein